MESTTFVMGFGVDVYFRRFSPANSFDLLKSDFDFRTLLATGGGVLLLVIITHFLGLYRHTDPLWE